MVQRENHFDTVFRIKGWEVFRYAAGGSYKRGRREGYRFCRENEYFLTGLPVTAKREPISPMPVRLWNKGGTASLSSFGLKTFCIFIPSF